MLKKLKSNRGASIMLAILMFLVCSIVGTILTVAGATAAGTASERVALDQRYYGVTSAMELLRGRFDGKEVKLHTVTLETPSGTIVDSIEGSLATPSLTVKEDPSLSDFLKFRTLCLLDEQEAGDWNALGMLDAFEDDKLELYQYDEDYEPAEIGYTLTVTKSDLEETWSDLWSDALQAAITVVNTAEGMNIHISSTTHGRTYELDMVLTADVYKSIVRTPLYNGLPTGEPIGYKFDTDYTVIWQVAKVTD